jgi:hypothetical protein
MVQVHCPDPLLASKMRNEPAILRKQICHRDRCGSLIVLTLVPITMALLVFAVAASGAY